MVPEALKTALYSFTFDFSNMRVNKPLLLLLSVGNVIYVSGDHMCVIISETD